MLKHLYQALTDRVLPTPYIADFTWTQCISQIPVLASLNRQDLQKLRVLTGLFLQEKTFTGADGLVIDEPLRVTIGAQACLLILNLDIDDFDGWREIIVYPGTFVVTREERDASGLIHETRRTLGGEAWSRGPVILSWSDSQPGAQPGPAGSNVILHEFAHKLDMQNGAANGMPPLHTTMSRNNWTNVWSQAYNSLQRQLEFNGQTVINPYAAESPAEFFAVCTEVFFEQPAILQMTYPDVYQQMCVYYRQDPYKRL